jgi:hypothetical protein
MKAQKSKLLRLYVADALPFCMTRVEKVFMYVHQNPFVNKSVAIQPWLWPHCFLFFGSWK